LGKMEKRNPDFRLLLALVLATLPAALCQGGTVTGSAFSPCAPELGKLLSKRIFFGHQSVGFNIIQGMQESLREKNVPGFNFIESRTFSRTANPAFFHATLGRNGDPLAKMRDFERIMRNNAQSPVDIAFMKLCFVDIGADTDIDQVFAAYRDTMAGLKLEFPRTLFVHVTVPLVARESGLRSALKMMLGRPVSGHEDNLAREKLNRLMRSEYAGKEPLFDLALFESTGKDGSRASFGLGSETYYALEEAYTDDGGHLNSSGRSVIAEHLLKFLAEALP
jgi:hypothetical protein